MRLACPPIEAPLDALGDDEDSKAMFRWFTNLATKLTSPAHAPSCPRFEDWLARQATIG